jgi:hypothetical protein
MKTESARMSIQCENLLLVFSEEVSAEQREDVLLSTWAAEQNATLKNG